MFWQLLLIDTYKHQYILKYINEVTNLTNEVSAEEF